MVRAGFQCEDLCTIVHGKPICAGPRGSGKAQWQTFDGSCALLIYNCEAKTSEYLDKLIAIIGK